MKGNRSSLDCTGCPGQCCRGPGRELTITDDPNVDTFETYEKDGERMLAQDEDGTCIYLSKATGTCSIYERRPDKCRAYDCREHLLADPVSLPPHMAKEAMRRIYVNFDEDAFDRWLGAK